FKKDAIIFAWEFLTEVLKIDPKRLYVTVHLSDDEAIELWHREIGIPKDRIFKKDKDNFWEMGEFGPCGPCSEIFYDHGVDFADPNLSGANLHGGDILDDGLRYVEIWNLVFMQYEKRPDGTFNLPSPCIDTGMGLERLAAVMQGKYWNYDTDCFSPLIQKIAELTGKESGDPACVASMRVVADHVRGATMLITDGVMPSNEGRGYVLRRIIRRAVRHLKELGAGPQAILLPQLVPTVFEILGEAYPENKKSAALAQKFLDLEERKFLETLEQGMRFLEERRSQIKDGRFSGEAAFQLYDTYGFPLDLTEVILREKSISVNVEEFEECMKRQQETSRKSWKGNQSSVGQEELYAIVKEHGASEFVGYEKESIESKLLKVIELESEHGGGDNLALVFKATPFYAESGGQIGDQGCIYLGQEKVAEVYDVKKPVEGLIVHYARRLKPLQEGKGYRLEVDQELRELTKRNHSATHLLHKALTLSLGSHVKQAGSFVSPERLRFDFTHFSAMTAEEMKAVQATTNQMIRKQLPVKIEIMGREEAQKRGAVALFGEKYGEKVRVVAMGDFSEELCGGTHVKNTAEIGYLSIVSESALSNGVRRIEAVVSENAIKRFEERSHILEILEGKLNIKVQEIPAYIDSIRNDLRNAEKEKKRLGEQVQQHESESMFTNLEELQSGVKFKAVKVAASAGGDLRRLSDLFVEKNKDGVVLLVVPAEDGKKFSALLRAHKDLLNMKKSIDCAGFLKQVLTAFNGNGGGRKDMAQGSGEILESSSDVQKFINEIRERFRDSL
ncbi:MAG: alanine--tRNA ligase, partial [Oligoflexia bacterium]|nr:alanine--tRNA ligase [Oligoflexia bacterium]